MSILSGAPSPIQRIDLPILRERDVELWIKRDDLLHPTLIGNKYRKSLVYFRQALATQHAVVTFGGAYSNHLLAVALMGQSLGLRTVGCVRGEIDLPHAPILARCRAAGMHLISVSRQAYYPEQAQMSEWLHTQLAAFAPYLMIPEGGTSAACLPDVAQLITELDQQLPDYAVIACPVGTGGTVAGLLYGLHQQQSTAQVWGLCAAKGYQTLPAQGLQALRELTCVEPLLQRLRLIEAAERGFGKISPAAWQDCLDLQQKINIPLDYVYTAKALKVLLEMIEQSHRFDGQRMVFIHTGGYQTASLTTVL